MSMKIISWNIKSLNSPEKQTSCLKELWRLKACIIFLQESYFRADKIPKLHNNFPTVCHSLSLSSNSKGTSILIAKSFPWKPSNMYQDPKGRFLLLKGKIYSSTFTLLNVYLPNTNPLTALESFLSTLYSFIEGTLILGGDFNMTIDPCKDSSAGLTSTPRGSRLCLKDLLHSHQLVDIWRTFHPQERDYTYYSPSHGSYSRIDFFHIKHSTIPLISKAEIGHITILDQVFLFKII